MTDLATRDRAVVDQLPPELRLVLGSAAGAGTATARALTQPLDWRVVAALADRERAAPAVLAAIRTHDPALAADDRLLPLRHLAQVAAFECARLEAKLLRTLDALGAAGHSPVLLKGAATAVQLRGTLRGRPMRDLDLLLPPEALLSAREAVATAGWRPARQHLGEAFYDGHAHLPPLDDADGTQLQLELHDDLFTRGHPFLLNGATVRADAVAVTWRDRTVRVPAAPHQLLHAATHAAWAHGMRGAWWRAWHDMLPLLPADDAGWKKLLETARAMRASSCLYWTLRLGRAFRVLEVPDAALDAVRPPGPRRLQAMLVGHFATEATELLGLCPSVRLSTAAWTLAIRPGWSGHGAIRPWSRAGLIDRGSNPAPGESGAAKVVRHLGSVRAYVAYLRRLRAA